MIVMKHLMLVALLVSAFAPDVIAGNINRAANRVPNEYILIFRDDAPSSSRQSVYQFVKLHHGRVVTTYDGLFKGAYVRLPEEVALRLADHWAIESVEENAVVETAASQSTPIMGATQADL